MGSKRSSRKPIQSRIQHWKLAPSYLVSASDISEGGSSRREKAVEKISKLTEVERVRIIQKISESHPVGEDLAKLLPWKPKKIELGKQRDSYYLLTNEKLQIERYKRELTESEVLPHLD